MDKCNTIRSVFKLITACKMSFKHQGEPLYFTINKDAKYTWPADYVEFKYIKKDVQAIIMIFNRDITKLEDNDIIITQIKTTCNKFYTKENLIAVYVFFLDQIIDVSTAFKAYYDSLMEPGGKTYNPFIDCVKEQVFPTCVPKDLYSPEKVNPWQFIALQCQEFLEQSTSSSMVFGFQEADWFTWPVEFIRSVSIELDDNNKQVLKDTSAAYKVLEAMEMKIYNINYNLKILHKDENSEIPQLMVLYRKNVPANNFILERTAYKKRLNVLLCLWGGLFNNVGFEAGIYSFDLAYEDCLTDKDDTRITDKDITDKLKNHKI